MPGNSVRITVNAKDEASGTFDKIRDKATLLSKTDIGKGMVTGAGIAGFNLLSGAVDQAADAVVNFAVESIDKASDLREAMSLNQQVFEDNSDAVASWADGAATAFGQSKREAINFAAGFGTAFKNVGMSLDETTAKSETLTHLAADLGSAFNTSSEEAATALRSGLLGESEPLRRFGVFLDEAKVKAKAAAMGMEPLNGALTDGQKVAARYAIIMEQTADSQGMFGRDTESAADAQKALGAEVENLQAQIGQELLPVVKDLTVFARDDLVPALQDTMKWIHDNGEAMEFLGHIIGGVIKGPANEAADIFKQQQQDMAEAAMVASAQGAEAWDTGSERIGQATGEAGGSLKDLASTAGSSSRKVVSSLDKIIWKAEDVRDKLSTLGSEAADAYFDPLIAEADYAATKRELAEQRAIIASKHSTKEQVRDAKARVTELEKTALEQQVALIGYGKMNASEQKKFLADLEKKWASATGEAKDDIRALINFINRIPTSRTVTITTRNRSVDNTNDHRAGGGPVSAGKAYIVGEKGQEVFTPSTDGFIIPNDKLAKPAGGVPTGGGSGPMTLTINVNTPLLTPGGAQALADAIAPSITRWQQQRGL